MCVQSANEEENQTKELNSREITMSEWEEKNEVEEKKTSNGTEL